MVETAPKSSKREPTGPLLQPGTVIDGKYRIQGMVGEGAMGQVFQAEHLVLRTSVALKVLNAAPDKDQVNLRRFEREARATLALDHPNIVRVMDYGELPNPYIVMEYIDGMSLRMLLESVEQHLPLVLVAGLLVQILSALEAAHSAGVVHRDLKPDNILLTRLDQGEPHLKVVDFGLARFEDSADQGPTLTQGSLIAGTPAYMSPEQCRSMVVGPASDLYAVGCILTEMLQLKPLFEADSAAVTMSHQMFTPPSALQRPPDTEEVPRVLEDLRLRLLSKLVHQRPASAREVLDHVEEIFAGASSEGRKASRASRPGRSSLRAAPSTPPDRPLEAEVVLYCPSFTKQGLTEACRAGLSMQKVRVHRGLPPEETPSIVLLDSEEPEEVVLGQLQELAARGHAVLVGVDSPDVHLLQRLVEAGASATVRRPLEPHSLVKAARRFLKRGFRAGA